MSSSQQYRKMTMVASIVGLCLAGFCSLSRAAIVIGPGSQTIDSNDTASPLVAVDLNNPQALSAGNYSAPTFNYQLTEANGGNVTPILAVSSGAGGYTVIALGSAVADSATTSSFISTPFGGRSAFTVPSGGETVYAGFYYDVTGLTPIGFRSSSSVGTYIRYSGPNAPAVGQDLSGGSTDFGPVFNRTYDFSVTVAPEPASLGLLVFGA